MHPIGWKENEEYSQWPRIKKAWIHFDQLCQKEDYYSSLIENTTKLLAYEGMQPEMSGKK